MHTHLYCFPLSLHLTLAKGARIRCVDSTAIGLQGIPLIVPTAPELKFVDPLLIDHSVPVTYPLLTLNIRKGIITWSRTDGATICFVWIYLDT